MAVSRSAGLVMKPSEKAEKGKRPRVLANIIKRPERILNSSGNRSFLNKTSNRYITELRQNNAKLAHSLALEKAKTAELFKRYTDCQSQIMNQKALLRSIFQSVKFSSSKFNETIDLMIQGSSIISAVNNKIISICPELQEIPLAQDSSGSMSSALTPNQMKLPAASDNNTSTSQSPRSLIYPEATPTTGSTVRHCTAKPMVKGQIISKPTITLQRLNVSSRPYGKGLIKPARGVMPFLDSDGGPRLSNVLEEMNESSEHGIDCPSPSVSHGRHPQNSSPASEPCSRRPLLASHVLLERMSPDTCLSHQLSSNDSAEEEFTHVHFGSLSYSGSENSAFISPKVSRPNSESSNMSKPALTRSDSENEDLALQLSPGHHPQNSSPASESCSRRPLPSSHVLLERMSPDKCLSHQLSSNDTVEEECTNVVFGSLSYNGSENPTLMSPRLSKPNPGSPNMLQSALACSDSEEYVSESSSEDEELALQIVESKRSFLERKRQLDSKEGTSWNYDEAGKFRERPPRKKKRSSSQSSAPLPSPNSRLLKRNPQKCVSNTREMRGKPHGIKTTLPLEKASFCVSTNSSKVVHNGSECTKNMGVDAMNVTLLEEQDMSFTCVLDANMVSTSVMASSENNRENGATLEGEQELPTHEPLSARKVYVTQRPRSRKNYEISRSKDMCSSPSLVASPMSRRTTPQIENNENSPPGHASFPGRKAGNDQDTRSLSANLQDPSRLPNVVLERLPSNVIYGSPLHLSDGFYESHSKLNSVREMDILDKLEAPSCEPSSLQSLATSEPTQGAKGKSNKRPNNCTNLAKNKIRVVVTESIKQESSQGLVSKPKENLKTAMSLDVPDLELNLSSNSTIRSTSGESNKSAFEPATNSEVKTQRESKSRGKRSKNTKKSSESAKGSVESSTSAPTSPTPRNSQDPLLSESENQRRRRHVAPANYKEPRCNVKMRRP